VPFVKLFCGRLEPSVEPQHTFRPLEFTTHFQDAVVTEKEREWQAQHWKAEKWVWPMDWRQLAAQAP
jgi:hypothetical protein